MKIKETGLKLNYDIGDVVVLDTGQNALILGYGIYDGQYWCVKNYTDGVHLGSQDYMFSRENAKAWKREIIELEKKADRIITTVQNYINALNDFVEQFYSDNNEYKEKYCEGMQLEFFINLLENLQKDTNTDISKNEVDYE